MAAVTVTLLHPRGRPLESCLFHSLKQKGIPTRMANAIVLKSNIQKMSVGCLIFRISTSSTPSRPDPSRSQTSSSLPAFSNPPPPPCRLRSRPHTPARHPAASEFLLRFSPDSAALLPSAKPHPPPPN